MAENKKAPEAGSQRKKWLIIIGLLFLLWAISMLIAGAVSIYFGAGGSDIETPVGRGNVAIIPIKGVISTEKAQGFFAQDSASSDKIVEFIKAANKDPAIKAIIFDINSPGGSPVASEEISSAIKSSDKYTVAVIRDMGTSGAYWAASACDKVVASKMSVTGSIGVLSSYLSFEGTMDKYGVNYERMVAGKYKDMGTPFRNMTTEEKIIFQKKIDKMHSYFIDSVSQNRNLTKAEAQKVSNGDFFIGEEAKELKLIDEFGNKDDAIKLIEAHLNTTARIVEYKEKQGFWTSLMSSFSKPSFYMGQGIGYALRDTKFESQVSVQM